MMANQAAGAGHSFWRLSRRRSTVLVAVLLTVAIIMISWTNLLGYDDYFGTHLRPFNLDTTTSADFVIRNKVAIIAETRPLENLVPLILHFSKVLGPTWPIVLYTYASTIPKLPTKDFLHATGPISVRPLPKGISFLSHKAVSTFLTTPWIWEQLAPADHVLLFQSDSIICEKATQKVDDYLEWDFIGAPIRSGLGQGYNGGLSLRNRTMFLDIVKHHDFEEAYQRVHAEKAIKDAKKAEEAAKAEAETPGGEGHPVTKKRGIELKNSNPFPDNWFPPDEEYEDQWFFQRLVELPHKPDGSPGAHMPSEEIAKTFSVETVEYDKPLGFHQIGVVMPHTVEQANQWCPEWRLCTKKLLPEGNEDGEVLEDE